MLNRRAAIGGVIAGLLIVAASVIFFIYATRPEVLEDPVAQLQDLAASPEPGPLASSGFIEAEDVDLAAEFGGRVERVRRHPGPDFAVP